MKNKKTLSYSAFLKRVKDTVKQYDMLHKGDRVLVAVSGGADSVCLLKALLEIRRAYALDVIVANMDHGLRGKESKRDSDFVKKLCAELDIKCVHKKVKISAKAKGISVEEAAREVRYDFFMDAARGEKCNVIATGHSIDDQAETMVMRMVYGASLAGMTGIPPVRDAGKVRIVRPLIRVSRKEIEGFLKKSELCYVEDSSNKDLKFRRNKVRQEILPFLEKQNPQIRRTLVNLSDTLREDLMFLSEAKEKSMKGPERGTKIKISEMLLQPKTVRKEIFKELFIASGGNVKKLTYRHWMDMDLFLRTAEKNKSLDLPGGVRVQKSAGEIRFFSSK